MVEVKSKKELKKGIRQIPEILLVVAKPYVSEHKLCFVGSLELIKGGLAGKLETRPSLELHLCCFPRHPRLGTCWADCCLTQGGFYVMCPVPKKLAYIYFTFLIAFLNYFETFCLVPFPPS